MTSQCWKGCFGSSTLSRTGVEETARSWRDPWRWASRRVGAATVPPRERT